MREVISWMAVTDPSFCLSATVTWKYQTPYQKMVHKMRKEYWPTISAAEFPRQRNNDPSLEDTNMPMVHIVPRLPGMQYSTLNVRAITDVPRTAAQPRAANFGYRGDRAMKHAPIVASTCLSLATT